MPHWVVIIIVSIVFTIIMEPITKALKRKISRKWLAFLLDFVIGWCIIMILYGIAALFGYSIYDERFHPAVNYFSAGLLRMQLFHRCIRQKVRSY